MFEMASPASARSNIIRPMMMLGIFDEDGSLTSLGNKWRNDATYGEACQEIIDKVYPAELAALVSSDGSPSASQVKTWLSHNGFGESNATQMAATYAMIASKHVPEAPSATDEKKTTPAKRSDPAKKAPAQPKQVLVETPAPPKDDPVVQPPASISPGIHLDIQIHVPAEASAEQIDAIFRSMAKHIYGRETD